MAKGERSEDLKEEATSPYDRNFTNLANRAQAESGRAYRAYTGDRIAKDAAETRAHHAGVREAYLAGSMPEFERARQLQEFAGQSYGTPGVWNTEAYDKYSNPYSENVIEEQERSRQRQFAKLANRMNRQGGIGNQLGDYRHNLAQGELAATTLRNWDLADAEAREREYERAYGHFVDDERRRIESAEGIQSVANSLESLGQKQHDTLYDRLDSMAAVGASKEAKEQVVKDHVYNDYLERRDWTMNNLSFYGDILSSIPTKPGYTRSVYKTASGPSVASQGVGAGIAALGIGAKVYNTYKGGKDKKEE